MSAPAPWLRWVAAIAVGLTVAVLSLRDYFPPLPSPLTFELELAAPGQPGTTEPLIVTGRAGAGDFLFVRHLPDGAIAVGYESWGEPGQFSEPLPVHADRRLRFTVATPGLTQVRGIFAPPTDRLQVTVNGVEKFNAPVSHHLRLPDHIWFAENPIGGTACGATLRGTLRLPDGRELRGSPTPLLSWSARTRAWLTISRWQAVFAGLLGLATYLLWPRLRWATWFRVGALAARGPRALAADPAGARFLEFVRAHRTFAVTGALATFAFAWMVSYGTLALIQPETFADFYDHQATSLLQGRLDVPRAGISGEAFIHDGKVYGYFGLAPAILRLPFVIYNAAFGELTRAFMVAGFAAALVACHLLLRTVYSLSGRGQPPGGATIGLVTAAGLGSTLYFLGSRAYVYHEAILWGITFALFGSWAAFRHLAAPGGRWWMGSLVCGILSVHARPPTGLFALTLLGVVALILLVRDRRVAGMVRRQLLVGALCGAGVFSFNVVSYLKFRTFEGCPLRYNVQYDAARLARIDGKQFHLVNIPIAIESYLLQPNFRLEAGFPYFYIAPGLPSVPWLETKIDYHDNTLGFPYAMPGLVWLAVAGGMLALTRVPALRGAVLATWAAALPMTLAMFAAIAITHRYTADFCPLLIVAAVGGLAAGDNLTGIWRRIFLAVTAVCIGASVLITLAITLHYQGHEVWGVPDEIKAKYAALRQGIDLAVGALRR
jgi:hypothetical protein